VTPHELRRLAVTSVLRNVCNVLCVQRMMGHASITMTQFYVQLVTSDLAAAHVRVSPVDRLQ